MSIGYDRRAFLKSIAGAVGVSLLAACAPSAATPGAPAQPAAGTTAGATTAPAATTATTKITYAMASYNYFHIVATIASQKPELTSKFGIQYDVLETTNSPNAVNALVGGSVTVAAVTPDSAWPAQDKVPDLKQILAIADGTPYVLVAQSEIKKASDMKGQIFGASAVRGGADTTAIRVMMLENGVKDSDYTIVQSGSISDRTAAMKAKSIQAVAQLEPQASLLRDGGFAEIDNGNNYPALKGVHSVVMLANKNWYAGSGADTAANLVRSWDAVTKWIYDPANRAEVVAIASKTMAAADKPAQNGYDLHIGGKSVSQNVMINEKMIQQFVDNQRRVGTENLPSDAMKYVDNSLVQNALKA